MKHLKIDYPCPMLLNRMTKYEDNFYCSSCKKQVVDFRNKTDDEIRNYLESNQNACGIFFQEQLGAQKKLSLYKQAIFYTLTFLSFLGFSVGPSEAVKGTKDFPKYIEISKSDTTSNKIKQKPKKKYFWNKKKKVKNYILGCPDF